MASTAGVSPSLFSKEAHTLGELKNFYLHIHSAPDDYGRRVYKTPSSSSTDVNKNEQADTSHNDGDADTNGSAATATTAPDVRVNPKPQLIEKDLEFQRENFHNLKLAYLEQETKEKFVRAVVSDPPLVIEASDIGNIELENNRKKKVLNTHKEECRELQRELDSLSREVCLEYEEMVGAKTDESIALIEEMEKMSKEIEELEAKHERLRIPEQEDEHGNKDPDLVLPLESIRKLVGVYSSRIDGIKTSTLIPLESELNKKGDELKSFNKVIQDLTEVHNRVQHSAQETVKIREHELKRGLEEKEATAKWFRNMLNIFNKATGISDFIVLEGHTDSGFSFNLLGASFEVVTNESGKIVSASVRDPLGRIDDAKTQEILNDTNNINRNDPSMFICQICFLLGGLDSK